MSAAIDLFQHFFAIIEFSENLNINKNLAKKIKVSIICALTENPTQEARLVLNKQISILQSEELCEDSQVQALIQLFADFEESLQNNDTL